MIDPFDITNYNRNKYELQEFLIFSICVAGKTAKQISIALDEFLKPCKKLRMKPFDLIRKYIEDNILLEKIKESSLGKHFLLLKGLYQIVNADLDLEKCKPEDLEKIHGIGQKTSRFFILHTRPAQNIAVLDTHILRYIREVLGYKKVPKSTPSSQRLYQELEKIFIQDAREKRKTVAQWDLEIWKMYARA